MSDIDRAREIHSKAIVVALHTDFIADVAERRTKNESNVMASRHLPYLFKGGISVVCDHVIGDTFEALCFPTKSLLYSFYPLEGSSVMKSFPTSQAKHALQLMDYMLSDINESHGDVLVCTNVDSIMKAKEQNKLGMVLCFQGAIPIEDDISLLRNFYRLGIRGMGLIVNRTNQVTESCWRKSNRGLTDFGFEVVKEANRLGIVLDVSHLSERGFADVLSTTNAPVVASNSNARAVRDHVRNLTDDQIHALAENGGVIGLHVLDNFISDRANPTMRQVIDHIDHITKLVGVEHVGIGPDIVSAEMYPTETYSRVWMGEKIWSGSYPNGLTKLSDLPNLTLELVRSGYSDNEIEKILGGNALRVFSKVWGS